MGTSKILSSSWRILTRYKSLWVLGFLAALNVDNSNTADLFYGFVGVIAQIANGVSSYSGNDYAKGLALGVFSIAILLLATLARIALVRQVAVADAIKRVSLSHWTDALREAVKSLRKILAMQFVVWSPALIVGVFLFSSMRSVFEGLQSNIQNQSSVSVPASQGGFTFLLAFLLAISVNLLVFVDAFAFRAILLEQSSGILQSIKQSVAITQTHFKVILKLSLACLIIGSLYMSVGGAISLPIYVAGLKALLPSLTSCVQPQVGTSAIFQCYLEHSSPFVLIVLTILFRSVSALILSPLFVFQSAAFTLLFNRITHKR